MSGNASFRPLSRSDQLSGVITATRTGYDGFADWYEEHVAPFTSVAIEAICALLGPADGSLIDIGCGGGVHIPPLLASGWNVTGVDLSANQLCIARERVGTEARLVQADATRLPFPTSEFDAAISAFTHTDLPEFSGLLAEAARVVRAGGRLVYVGVHPCWVGPHALYREDEPPLLFFGYGQVGWRNDAPGFGEGLRRKVGSWHLPLSAFINAFLSTGWRLEHVGEPWHADYPRMIAVSAIKG